MLYVCDIEKDLSDIKKLNQHEPGDSRVMESDTLSVWLQCLRYSSEHEKTDNPQDKTDKCLLFNLWHESVVLECSFERRLKSGFHKPWISGKLNFW